MPTDYSESWRGPAKFGQSLRPVCTVHRHDLRFGCPARSEGGVGQTASLTEGMDGTQKVELALRAVKAARFFCAPRSGLGTVFATNHRGPNLRQSRQLERCAR